MQNAELPKFVVRSAGCSTIALLGLVTVAALLLLEPVPATAQRVVPKLIEDCPIGYADPAMAAAAVLGVVWSGCSPVRVAIARRNGSTWVAVTATGNDKVCCF